MSRIEHLAEGVTLYLGDCREILPRLEPQDALISDPPYGISFSHGGNDRSGIGKGKYATKFAKVLIEGDADSFDPRPLLSLAEIVILWGSNHFANYLPPSAAWFVWDKRAASHHTNDFADCEMAWTNRTGVARVFRHQWDGMMKASERGEPRCHPTQKPVELMRWCLSQIPDAKTIIDPYMGSGTTGVAAVKGGLRFTGIEIDPGYFETACRRVSEALSRPDLFVDQPAPAKQEAFL